MANYMVFGETSQAQMTDLKFAVHNEFLKAKVTFLTAGPSYERLVEIGQKHSEGYVVRNPWARVQAIQIKIGEGVFAILGLLLYPYEGTSDLVVRLVDHLSFTAGGGVGKMGEWEDSNGIIEYKVMEYMIGFDDESALNEADNWMRNNFQTEVDLWSAQRKAQTDQAGLL